MNSKGYIDLTGSLPSLKSSLTPSAPGYHPAPPLFTIPPARPLHHPMTRLFMLWLVITAVGVAIIACS